MKKVSNFVKMEIILLLLCCLLDPLTNKYFRPWIFLIYLSIDSRVCQKNLVVINVERSNKYLGLPWENVLRNMMLSHWPCFTRKFFMVWLGKILKLNFHKQLLFSKIYVLNIEENYLNWRLSEKFSYTFRTTILLKTCKQLC